MIIDASVISGRERYELVTSLVVPRPIGWLSTRSSSGQPNLAPFSYYAAISATPMLVSVSIGRRQGVPKDSLRYIRDSGAFCINFVSEDLLDSMNSTSGPYAPGVNEFEIAGLTAAEADAVSAPYVAECRAVLECRLFKEVQLDGSANTLVIGEVVQVRLADGVRFVPGTRFVETEWLAPVARLWGDRYGLLGEMRALPRPGGGAPEGG